MELPSNSNRKIYPETDREELEAIATRKYAVYNITNELLINTSPNIEELIIKNEFAKNNKHLLDTPIKLIEI